ncbi:hypothetical protein GCM10022253_20650 [Sphingomonas endophytica]|uniref:Repeat protein (TIGR01451 family) n=1 Tax=Sphingomonas endophytica TaxID=869719 RepID=A0A7X0ML83_9SPHN|nr:hypothetical protein [Sphingomonas endophytica]MBB5724710.1 putative repeat protein (TIGR01451 family) [Sphingomonas endophytica]MBB6503372.1 putative repeat protein (TIGR01451 family) [Sphingomonas endophytica]
MPIRPLLLLAAAALAAPALAAGPLQVTSQVMVEAKQRAADGTTRIALVPAQRVVPGDRVVFTLAYRNTGTQPLADLVFDNPVPRGVAYRAPAPNSPAPELSVDGRRYGTLAQLGAAGPDAVTHVRWRLARPLAPGASGTFAFHAVLK